MARGFYSTTVSIASNTDTAIIAAPGTLQAPEVIYILYAKISTSVAGTSSRARLENGVGGSVILRAGTTTADVFAEFYAATGADLSRGYALSPVTALNCNTAGSGAATIEVTVEYEIR